MLTGASRQLGALLLAAALLLRVAVPAGWMPVVSPDGVSMVLCSGNGPMVMPAAGTDAAHAMPDMPGMAGSAGHHPTPPAHDIPCGFAAIAETAPPLDAILALVVPAGTAATALAMPPVIRSGSGIGTPPRPSTGPPLTA